MINHQTFQRCVHRSVRTCMAVTENRTIHVFCLTAHKTSFQETPEGKYVSWLLILKLTCSIATLQLGSTLSNVRMYPHTPIWFLGTAACHNSVAVGQGVMSVLWHLLAVGTRTLKLREHRIHTLLWHVLEWGPSINSTTEWTRKTSLLFCSVQIAVTLP
jgi:hypothetical protein